jgi:hypothetical protein
MAEFITSTTGYSIAELSAGIQTMPVEYLEITKLFEPRMCTVPYADVEIRRGVLSFVNDVEWGASASGIPDQKRELYPFKIPHFPEYAKVGAASYMGVRQFGTVQPDSLLQRINDRMAEGKFNLIQTIERICAGVIETGIATSPGTSNTLANYLTATGRSLQTATMYFDDDKENAVKKTQQIVDTVYPLTGGTAAMSNNGVRMHGYCGISFFNNLANSAAVKDIAKYQYVLPLLTDLSKDGIEVGDCHYTKYRGASRTDGSSAFTGWLTTTKAVVVPVGVPGLFIRAYAPADYEETVGTVAQEFYAKTWPIEFNKGYQLEMQSNCLPILPRPELITIVTYTTGSIPA